jgi:quercetin dioxygenase-like cupin family protein
MDSPSGSRPAQAAAANAVAEAPANKQSLGDLMETRVARLQTRTYDWHALKFQADFDPKYRRAQMRYMGTGGTGVESDGNTVPSEHFTFSTMVLPPGCEGPLHVHPDVEEVFFMLRGKVRLFFEKDGEKWETVIGERDLISVPPGVYRGLINENDEEALMCVMLGASKPKIPTYPPDHPVAKLERGKKK